MDLLSLTTATITKVKVVGMGDRVCVDLCSLMQPGEGLLVCFLLRLRWNSDSQLFFKFYALP